MALTCVGYENLHLHTDYSTLDGFGTVEEYASRAPTINQKFFSISDHGMMGAVPRQIKACDKINDKLGKDTLSPIYAVELYVNRIQPEVNSLQEMQKFMADLDETQKKECGVSAHLLAIAYNEEGYKNLVRLSSWGWTKGYYKKPRVSHAMLRKHKEGILFTSCCYASEVGKAFDRGGDEAGFKVIEEYIEMFGRDHYFLELMLLDFVKQKPYDAFIIRAHEKYGLPLILTGDCLVRGTQVLTESGHKNIENVIIGEKVLTHEGRFRSVQYVNCRKVNAHESVYRVKAAMGTLAWEATGNHQVRTASVRIKRNKRIFESFSWKRVDELIAGEDYLVVPKVDQDWLFAKSDLSFIDLRKILPREVYDIDTVGRSLKLRLEKREFVSHRGFDRRTTVKIPELLPVTDDLLSILGLYMAEGGLDQSSNQVSFGLHISEIAEEQLLERYFGKFGITLSKYTNGNGRKVEFQSVVFRNFFEIVCGKGGLNKHFPVIDGVFPGKFSREQVIKIVKQYWMGDGSNPEIHDRAGSVGSVAKSLIYDLATVLNALGFPVIPSFRDGRVKYHKNPQANPANWNKWYYVSVGSNTRVRLEKLLGMEGREEKQKKRDTGRRYIELPDCYLTRIRSISKIEYSEEVYNLQVEEDESYVAGMFQLHNCHYCRPEDSHYQRLMLMVQTKRTILDIKRAMAENDMQDFFELQDSNLWMKSEEEQNEKWEKDYREIIPYELFCQAKKNTVEICRKAKGVQLDRSNKLPVLPDADERLKEEMLKGFKLRGLPQTREYLDRIKEEYSLITRKGFASYFLIQKMMTDEARRICPQLLGWGDGSQAVGFGRGSGAGSLAAYLLGITQVDPVYEGLLFSRFMSEARGGRQISLEFEGIDPLPPDVED